MSQVTGYVEVPQETKYKLVPPDGGWGYMVVIAFILYAVSTKFYFVVSFLFNSFNYEIFLVFIVKKHSLGDL